MPNPRSTRDGDVWTTQSEVLVCLAADATEINNALHAAARAGTVPARADNLRLAILRARALLGHLEAL